MENIIWSVLVVGGWGLAMLALPGIWAMWLTAALYIWRLGFPADSLLWLGQLLFIGLAAEAVEALGGFWGVRRYKASWRTAFWAAGGAVTGAIVGSLALPLVGTAIGAATGAYLATYATERMNGQKAAYSRRIAWAAACSQMLAYIAKLAVATVMAGWILWRIWNN